MMWYAPGTSGWGFALMTVGTVLSWALIIFGVIVVVRHLTAGATVGGRYGPLRTSCWPSGSPAGRSTSRSTTNAWMRCTAGPDPCSGPKLAGAGGTPTPSISTFSWRGCGRPATRLHQAAAISGGQRAAHTTNLGDLVLDMIAEVIHRRAQSRLEQQSAQYLRTDDRTQSDHRQDRPPVRAQCDRAGLARPVGAQHPALALDDRPPRRAPQRRPSPPAAGDRRRR
jgi:hypothetical protein